MMQTPRPTLLCLCSLLFAAACGDDEARSDAGTVADASTDTSGPSDAGADILSDDGGTAVDAEGRDAGGGATDAGGDAGPDDAGPMDVSGPCRPFTELGCEAGQWCKPDDTDVSMGVCANYGGQAPGAVCITSIDCPSGHLCTGPDEASICETACDPASPQGSDSNPCASGTRCANLRNDDGEPIALGICIPSCDYDSGVPCPGDLTCQPHEIVSAEVDVCLPNIMTLPEQGDCALAGIPHGQLCGSNRICLMRDDLRPGRQCYAICRADVGRLNFAEHPDCGDAKMVCQQFAVGLGVCL